MTRTTRLAASLLLGLTAIGLLHRNAQAQGDGVGLISDPQGKVFLAESVITENSALGQRRVPFGPKYRAYSQYGDGFGWNTEGQTYANVFYPLHLNPFVDLFFVDARAYVAYNTEGTRARSDDRYGANVGVGYRRYIESINTIVGGSIWYDVDGAQRQTWQQYGASLEAIINGFEVRLNGYAHDGDGVNGVASFFTGSAPRFTGNFIVATRRNIREFAFNAAELEVGGPVPYAQNIGLNAYVGGYWLDNDKADISRGGVKGRVELYLHEDVQMGMEIRKDDVFGHSMWGSLSVQLPNAPWRVWMRQFLQPRGPQQHLARQTERRWRIPVRQIVEDEAAPLLNPKDGQPLFVVHVDPNGAAGNGTFESPFNSASFANNANVDIIRVLPGNFAPPGGVTLFDCQRLLGATQSHFFESNAGRLLLPGQVVGADPVISNPLGGNVVTLANVNEVSAVDINGGGTGVGIIGTGIRDFNLNRLDIMAATRGIDIRNFASSGAAPPNGQPNTISDVNVTGSTFNGVRLTQADGTATSVNVTRLSSSTNGSEGLLLLSTGGSTINATVSNSAFNANGGSGLRANAFGAMSSVVLTASNLIGNTNAFDGLLLDARLGGNITATVTNSSFIGNTRNAIRQVLDGGSTVTVTASDIIARNSGQHGVFFNVLGGSTLNATYSRITATNNGQTMMALLRDGFNIEVSGANSSGNLTITDSTSRNTAGTTQHNGLRTLVSSTGSLVVVVNGTNDFSNNAVSAFNSVVTDAGSTSTLTVSGTNGNNSGMDGFFYNINGGAFTANVTNSSFNSSGRNAIRAIGGLSPAVVNVSFNSTSANLSGAEGVRFEISNAGGGASVFNFTYLPTAPSAILGSGGPFGVHAMFGTNAAMTGTVSFNGITIDGGINDLSAGTGVTVTP